jgi:hypothetical protein
MKQYAHTITVKGSGQFPVDMLRYDCCWPITESDSHQIMLNPNDDPAYFNVREVRLTRMAHRHWQPTEGRWKSFTWEVTDHSYQR